MQDLNEQVMKNVVEMLTTAREVVSDTGSNPKDVIIALLTNEVARLNVALQQFGETTILLTENLFELEEKLKFNNVIRR